MGPSDRVFAPSRLHLSSRVSGSINPSCHTLRPLLTSAVVCADMIHEKEPVTNAFVSVPSDMGQLNCAAYIAGIIAGVLDGASFVSPNTHGLKLASCYEE